METLSLKVKELKLKNSDMRFATKRLFLTSFIHKMFLEFFKSYLHLKNLGRRIVVKSELVFSFNSLTFKLNVFFVFKGMQL